MPASDEYSDFLFHPNGQLDEHYYAHNHFFFDGNADLYLHFDSDPHLQFHGDTHAQLDFQPNGNHDYYGHGGLYLHGDTGSLDHSRDAGDLPEPGDGRGCESIARELRGDLKREGGNIHVEFQAGLGEELLFDTLGAGGADTPFGPGREPLVQRIVLRGGDDQRRQGGWEITHPEIKKPFSSG